MDAKQFLSTVLSDEGYYCILGIRTSDNKTVQKFYNTIDSVIDSALNFDHDGYDTYFALSTFLESTSRKTDNVSFIKSLFLDLDCGEGKPYKTQTDAVTSLRAFCKELDLPKPTVVNSGRGIHVYWALKKSCSRKKWLPVAEQLKNACIKHNLAADPVVTSDAARILRVPDTHNFKTSPAADVHILVATTDLVDLKDFSNKLGNDTMPVPKAAPDYSEADKASMEALLGNYTKKFSKIIEKTIKGKGCGQIDRAIKKPAKLDYGQWTDVISIAKSCEEGMIAVHAISSKYPDYSADETEKVAASIKYPHLCVTFESNCPKVCKKCPLRGKIKSPISLGMEVREATEADNVVQFPVKGEEPSIFSEATDENPDKGNGNTPKIEEIIIPTYPYPYFRGANGGVYLRSKNKVGDIDEIEIHKQDLWIIKRIRDPLSGPSYVFRHRTVREGIKEFVVPGVSLSSREEFRKAMGMNDIFLIKPDQLMAYVGAWVIQVQRTHDEIEAKMQFGWTKDNKSFVIGRREVFANKVEENPESSTTRDHMKIFNKKGTLKRWKEIPKFYNKPNFETHKFMFALSFAAPLMEFVPKIMGGIFHINSMDSGFGKTTGMFGGASVWGKPTDLVLAGIDTTNSMWGRAEVYKNLPVYVDEISNIPAKAMSDFAYNVALGKQKNRQSNVGQNKERWRGEDWSLLVGTSANTSLLEKITTYRATPKGEAQRVFETRMPVMNLTPEEAVQGRRLNEFLEENYGHAGEVYIQHIIQHISGVKRLVNYTINKLTLEAGLNQQNRLISAIGGTILVGVIVAKRIGLVDWDLKAFAKWILKKLKGMRRAMKDMDVDITNLINEWLNENEGGVLRIKSTDDSRHKSSVDEGLSSLVIPEKRPIYNNIARHEYDVGRLYLMPKPFKEWCIKQQYNYASIVDLIIAERGGERKKVKMGKGTTNTSPAQHVIALNWFDEDKDD